MRGLIRRIQNRGYATLTRIADHIDAHSGRRVNAVIRDARRRQPHDRPRVRASSFLSSSS
jgi:hypothetical protein